MTGVRVTAQAVEVLHNSSAASRVRVTAQAVEVLHNSSAASRVRVTAQAVEVLHDRYPIIAGNISESTAITDWQVTSVECKTGTSVVGGSNIFSGSTYRVHCLALTPHLVILSPKIDYAWSAAKATVLNDYVVAVNPDTTPHLWKCTTAGTTHATTEPTWNLSGTTTDNTTTWTYVAPLVDPITLGPKIPS